MTTTPEQQKKLDNLAREYAATVFGIEYHPDIRVIPEGKSGSFEVKDDIDIENEYIYQVLYHNGKPVANNDPKNLSAHLHFFKNAAGRILISRLGLGESLNQLLKNPAIDFIRIIEREQDIIDLVAPSYANDSRVEIIQGDILKYQTEAHFDCIYHAIWNSEKEARAAVSLRQKLKDLFDSKCDWHGFAYISTRGGYRRGAGRTPGTTGPNKPEDQKRTIKKGVRYKPKEIELIKQAAELSGKTESEIAVSGALKEAVRIIYKIDDSRLSELVKKIEAA